VPERVLAIVIAYRSSQVIAPMLESLAREAVPGLRVVIVDNSADEATADLVAASALPFDVEYEASDNVGYAGGLNKGLERLRHDDDAVLVLNPDLVILPGALQRLCQVLADDAGVGMALPSYVDRHGRRVPVWTELPTPGGYWRWALPDKRARRVSASTVPRNVEWGPGACMLARAEAVRQVGGMDERIFLFMEDADWCRRFLGRGWTVRLEPDAAIAHDWGHAANADAVHRVLQTHLAKLYYFQKWYGRRGLLLAALQMVGESVGKILHDGLTGRNPMRLSGYALLLRSLPLAVAEGPIEAQNRLVPRG
jgi:GT2 family glycosyltransferase